MSKVSAVSERLKAKKKASECADLLTIRVLNDFKQFELKNPVIDAEAQDEYYWIVTRIAYVILKTAISENKPVFKTTVLEKTLNGKLKYEDTFAQIDYFLIEEALHLLIVEGLIFLLEQTLTNGKIYCMTERCTRQCFPIDFSIISQNIQKLSEALKLCAFSTAEYIEDVREAGGHPGRRLSEDKDGPIRRRNY